MWGAEIDWARWAIYFLAAVPFLAWLLFTTDNVMRLLAVAGTLIFVQDSLAGRRHLWAFALGPSLMVCYAALSSVLLQRGRLPRLGAVGPLWLGYLVCGFGTAIGGSIGTDLLRENLRYFQFILLEGFFLFLTSTSVLRSVDEAERFVRRLPWIGLGVAAIHLFAIATGFRFRDALEGSYDSIYYGANLGAANSLGSFYGMMIPTALFLLLRVRLSRLGWAVTTASLIAMIGSLFVSSSRGGMLVAVVVSVMVLAWSGAGIGRALLTAGFAVLALAGTYWMLVTVLPDEWQQVLGLLEEEGLESTRLANFAIYLRIVLDHPFGVGMSPENVVAIASFYRTFVHNAHNAYLNAAVYTGWAGLTVLLALFSVLLARNVGAIVRAREPQRRALAMAFFVPLLAYLLVATVEPVMFVGYKVGHFFWLIAGASWAACGRILAEARAPEIGAEAEGAAGLSDAARVQHA